MGLQPLGVNSTRSLLGIGLPAFGTDTAYLLRVLPTLIFMFLDMARSYNEKAARFSSCGFILCRYELSLRSLLRLNLHQRFVLNIHFTLARAAARCVPFRSTGVEFWYGFQFDRIGLDLDQPRGGWR